MAHLARPFIPLIALLLMGGAALSLEGREMKLNGVEYISLKTVAGELGMKRTWATPRKKMVLQSKWTRMEFYVHKRDMRINNVRVFLGSPVAFQKEDLYLGKLDLEYTIAPILTPQIYSPVPQLHRIALDPGHGGKDPGARNSKRGLVEKTLTLDISERLGRVLRESGYDVISTRESDLFIPLDNRPKLANEGKADLFISIHLNAVESSRVKGAETYAFTPRNQSSTKNSKPQPGDRKFYPGNRNNPWSTLIGFYVQRELVKTLKTSDRGIKRARWEVLKSLNCPGLLVEAGFVTNTEEARNLSDARYRQKIAQSIADGIARYRNTLHRLRGKTSRLDPFDSEEATSLSGKRRRLASHPPAGVSPF